MSTCSGWSTPRLPHLTETAHITMWTSTQNQGNTQNKTLTPTQLTVHVWKRQNTKLLRYRWQQLMDSLSWLIMAPAAKLTCTWADPLHQCSRFHHSCICMQGALQQGPQWLQGQKPGIHTISNDKIKSHWSLTKAHWSSQAHVEGGFMNVKLDVTIHTRVQSVQAVWLLLAVYLHHIRGSQYSSEGSLAGRHRCTH